MDENNNEQSNIKKIKEIFKDKKNIAIAILTLLLLFSFISSTNTTNSNTTSYAYEIKELKGQIEQLTSNNNELKSKIEESNSKNKALENNLKQLQEENQHLKNNVPEQKSETTTLVESSTPQTENISSNELVNSSEEKPSTYILNKNTKVFHELGCSSISKMKDSNKEEYTGSRDNIISRGYSPCKICNP